MCFLQIGQMWLSLVRKNWTWAQGIGLRASRIFLKVRTASKWTALFTNIEKFRRQRLWTSLNDNGRTSKFRSFCHWSFTFDTEKMSSVHICRIYLVCVCDSLMPSYSCVSLLFGLYYGRGSPWNGHLIICFFFQNAENENNTS